MAFKRTDPTSLIPTIIATPTYVQRVGGAQQPITASSNALKIAYDLALPGDVIGLIGAHRGVTFGDGKSKYYPDSVNKPGGCHDINVVGLSQDAAIHGTLMVRNNLPSASGNHRLGWFGLQLTATTGYACAQTFINSKPTYGLEFVDCDFYGNATRGTYSHVRFQGPCSFSVRDSRFHNAQPVKEHCLYWDNWCDETEIINNDFWSTTGSVQGVNRIESGPPQLGDLTIQNNRFHQPGDSFAITVAGASDPNGTVWILRNSIELEDNGDAGGILCYREGAVPTLHVPKLGSWPVGSTGNEGWTPTNLPDPRLPTLAKVVLRVNRVEGNGISKQLVCVGSTKLLRVEGGNRFISTNQPALQINYQSMVEKVELLNANAQDKQTWQGAKKIVDMKGGSNMNTAKALTDAQINAMVVSQ